MQYKIEADRKTEGDVTENAAVIQQHLSHLLVRFEQKLRTFSLFLLFVCCSYYMHLYATVWFSSAF